MWFVCLGSLAPAAVTVEYEGRLAPGATLRNVQAHFVTWARSNRAAAVLPAPDSRSGVRVVLHPAGHGIPIAPDAAGQFAGRVVTSDLGPGYHQAVVGVLRVLKERFAPGLVVRDGSRYWQDEDRGRLAERMLHDKLQVLDAALRKWPDDAMARLATPMGEYDRRSVERMRDALRRKTGTAPWFIWWSRDRDGPYWVGLGCTIYSGRFLRGTRPANAPHVLKAVEAYFRRGRSQGCETWLSRYYLGRIEQDRGRLDSAVAWYRAALEQNDDQPDVMYALGRALLESGQLKKAAGVYGILTAMLPDSGEVWFRLGVAKSMQRSYAEALAALDKATRLMPDLARAWAERGLVLRELGRAEEALAALKRSLALDPGQADALYNLGVTYAKMGRAPEAAAALDKCLNADPKHYDAIIERGIIELAQGDLEAAHRRFHRATRTDARRWEAFYNLGRVFEQMGRPTEARQAFREAGRRGAPKEKLPSG